VKKAVVFAHPSCLLSIAVVIEVELGGTSAQCVYFYIITIKVYDYWLTAAARAA